ncbi:MAG: gntR [Hyphomicrobiales bacterium]|nr:gntR [Hyphomicrobiales bacterium]
MGIKVDELSDHADETVEPERRTRADRLAADLADAILSGGFAAGARLDEHGLAERYGVSRTPVREALRQLAATGLIEMRPRRGAFVASITDDALSELFVAMGELEATCARLAALSMNPLERRRLESLHGSMAGMIERGEEEDYAEANRAFHHAIYAGAHNGVLLDIANSLRRRLDPFRQAQFRASGRLEKSHHEHDLVVRAILSGDCAGAHARMLDHVHSVEHAVGQLKTRAAPLR